MERATLTHFILERTTRNRKLETRALRRLLCRSEENGGGGPTRGHDSKVRGSGAWPRVGAGDGLIRWSAMARGRRARAGSAAWKQGSQWSLAGGG
jgi:hypothetical protein